MARIKRDPNPSAEPELNNSRNDQQATMETTPSSYSITSLTPEQGDVEMADELQTNTGDQNASPSTADTEAVHGDPPVTDDDAMHNIGADSRELISFIQKLETLSIKNTLPSLPKFVVVGDQSAGKSSVIEALCDIKLPRGEGTCTRCPFKITTTSSKGDRWSCKISVHRRFRYDITAREGQYSPYRHWVEEEDVAIFDIATIHDKDDVELELRRAQVAILNPQYAPTDFIGIDMSPYLAPGDMEHNGLVSVGFSPNWVALEISSPNLPELCLYDLPGVINRHGDKNKQYLVGFVESLVKSYMEEEKTLVLLAHPMNTDMDNATAFRWIDECNALDRSMGVRTKPDTVTLDQKRLALEEPVLRGHKFELNGGGWYITRQCSQDEIEQGNISYAEARRIEDKFFAHSIWKQLPQELQNRLGTRNLQAALSEKLTSHIRDEIPTIFERVQNRRSHVEKELAKFPAPEENASITVMREIGELKAQLTASLSGNAIGSDVFSSKFRNLFKDLAKDLRDCSPELTVITPGWTSKTIEIDDDEDGCEQDVVTPSKRAKIANGRAVSTTPIRQKQRRGMRSGDNVSGITSPPTKLTIDLEKLQKRLDSAPGADIPGQTDEKVIKQLMIETVSGWSTAVQKMFKDLKTLLKDVTKRALGCIAARRGTAFHEAVVRCVFGFLDETLKEHETRIDHAVAAECYIPFTVSKNFAPEITALTQEHGQRRNVQRVKEYFDEPPDGIRRLNDADQTKKAADPHWMMNNLGPDKYDREINGFVRIAAYYNTTYSQLVDYVAKATHFHVLRSFEARLFDRLVDELQVNDRSHCEHLLARDQNQQRQYQALLAEHKKLNAALEELRRL